MAKKHCSNGGRKKPRYVNLSSAELDILYLALFNLALDVIMEEFCNGKEEN